MCPILAQNLREINRQFHQLPANRHNVLQVVAHSYASVIQHQLLCNKKAPAALLRGCDDMEDSHK